MHTAPVLLALVSTAALLIMPVALPAAEPGNGAKPGAASPVIASNEDRGLRLVVAAGGTNQLRGDLAGDGRILVVSWSAQATGDAAGSWQLVTVSDESGSVVWTSPPVTDAGQALAFGKGDTVTSFPEALLDMDGDGRLEMIAPSFSAPPEPKCYRTFRWTGTEFKPIVERSLSRSGGMDTLFMWQPKADPTQFWVDGWVEAKSDTSAVVKLARRDDAGNRIEAVAPIQREGSRYVRETWVQRPVKQKKAEGNEPTPAN